MKVNNMIFRQSDRHFLKMIRDQIVLVTTKGITGFDSPILLNSLKESAYSYQTILEVINIYKDVFTDTNLYQSWNNELKESIRILNQSDFDGFDRYSFIKNHTNKQLALINETAKDWDIKLKDRYRLNPTSENLFAQDFFNLSGFSSKRIYKKSDSVIQLGKKLFNDKSLSKDNVMSCATCHDSKKHLQTG